LEFKITSVTQFQSYHAIYGLQLDAEAVSMLFVYLDLEIMAMDQTDGA
jgi:hypothetical protein